MKVLIGENIKRLRREKNITQEQLAEAMNISCPAVSKWERGESYPDITLLAPLAYYFGVSIDDLMGYDAVQTEKEIESLLDRFNDLLRSDYAAGTALIQKARKDYPNDYHIMHCYMWHIAGDYADNNPDVLISHKDEFLDICQKIEDGCKDIGIRLDALNMRAKIHWAEGNTDKALEIYDKNFSHWLQSSAQKIEQLFPKDSKEFMYWVRRNSYELVTFAGDKLVKTVFFDKDMSYDERVKKAEHYGDLMADLYEETKEPFFLVLERSIFGRLTNDLYYRGGEENDAKRVEEKLIVSKEKLAELAKTYPIVAFFAGKSYC